jgi:hypothetical protein
MAVRGDLILSSNSGPSIGSLCGTQEDRPDVSKSAPPIGRGTLLRWNGAPLDSHAQKIC